jgi:hypothetical protein
MSKMRRQTTARPLNSSLEFVIGMMELFRLLHLGHKSWDEMYGRVHNGFPRPA